MPHFDLINRDWRRPAPIHGAASPYQGEFISAPAVIFAYAAPDSDIDVPLQDHLTGNPQPAIRQVTGLPDWGYLDGTHIRGRVPTDEDETYEVEVEVEN